MIVNRQISGVILFVGEFRHVSSNGLMRYNPTQRIVYNAKMVLAGSEPLVRNVKGVALPFQGNT